MPTYTAATTLPGKDAADALGEGLERLTPAPTGVGVALIAAHPDRWQVTAYFAAPPAVGALALLAAAFDVAPFSVVQLPDEDWVARVRRDLAPVRAGRFFVHASHDADKVPAGAVGLLVEAALAFGTGHHATTLGCLRALEALAAGGFAGRNVADIGCGTAVLAMAAARIWPGVVLAGDIDPVAVGVARTNVGANALDGRVICVEAAGFDHADLRAAMPFDLVFANILKGALIGLAPDMADSLGPGGYAILSGILNEQADEVIAIYARNGFNLVSRILIVEWSTLTLRKT